MLANTVGTAHNPLYQISNDAGTDIAMPVRRPRILDVEPAGLLPLSHLKMQRLAGVDAEAWLRRRITSVMILTRR